MIPTDQSVGSLIDVNTGVAVVPNDFLEQEVCVFTGPFRCCSPTSGPVDPSPPSRSRPRLRPNVSSWRRRPLLPRRGPRRRKTAKTRHRTRLRRRKRSHRRRTRSPRRTGFSAPLRLPLSASARTASIRRGSSPVSSLGFGPSESLLLRLATTSSAAFCGRNTLSPGNKPALRV